MSEHDICCCLCIGLAHICENSDNNSHNQNNDCCWPCCLSEMPDAYLAIPEPVNNVNIIDKAKENTRSKMK